MNYTEVPTDVLRSACMLAEKVKNKADNPTASEARSGTVAVRFTKPDMADMEPLFKWLEYIAAVWQDELSSEDPWSFLH